jgi:hypothetical protein
LAKVPHGGKDAVALSLGYGSLTHFVEFGLDDGRWNAQFLKNIMKGGQVSVECRLEGPYRKDNGEKGAIRHEKDQPVVPRVDEVHIPVAKGGRWRLVLSFAGQV